MAESVNRYFRLMHVARRQQLSPRMWCPAADVYRTSDGWLVKLDLAGVGSDDIEITIEEQTLRVAGIRRDSVYEEGLTYHQLEITYSRFEKTLRFPCSIKGATLAQDYRDGLLIIRLRSKENCGEGTDKNQKSGVGSHESK
ncbi:MAG: Hsp20/alpha crystallin family protein [Pyrinomonadaceae bacterium]